MTEHEYLGWTIEKPAPASYWWSASKVGQKRIVAMTELGLREQIDLVERIAAHKGDDDDD